MQMIDSNLFVIKCIKYLTTFIDILLYFIFKIFLKYSFDLISYFLIRFSRTKRFQQDLYIYILQIYKSNTKRIVIKYIDILYRQYAWNLVLFKIKCTCDSFQFIIVTNFFLEYLNKRVYALFLQKILFLSLNTYYLLFIDNVIQFTLFYFLFMFYNRSKGLTIHRSVKNNCSNKIFDVTWYIYTLPLRALLFSRLRGLTMHPSVKNNC